MEYLYMALGFALYVLVLAIPFAEILSKAGRPRWLALVFGVPGVNFFALYWLAFSAWPSTQNVKLAK